MKEVVHHELPRNHIVSQVSCRGDGYKIDNSKALLGSLLLVHEEARQAQKRFFTNLAYLIILFGTPIWTLSL